MRVRLALPDISYIAKISPMAGSRLQIREFQLGDYEEVVELWKACGIILRPGDELDGIKLKLQRDQDLFLVAENDQQILGVVLGAWDGRRGWINHLAVRSGHRRSGVGKALVRELERRLAKKGALKVNAQIYKSNKQSSVLQSTGV